MKVTEAILMRIHNIPLSIQKKVPGTQGRVRNRRGKRAVSVRATKVLLYLHKSLNNTSAAKLIEK